MTTINLLNGTTIDIFESRKEALSMTIDANGKLTAQEIADMTIDGSIYIVYNDGSTCWLSEGEAIGKLKRTGIKYICMTDCNGQYVWGSFKIVNRDDLDEEYSEEADSDDKDWMVTEDA